MIQRAAIRVVVEPRPDGGCDVVGEGFYCLAMFARASRKPRPTLEAVLDHALNACLDRLPAPPPVGAQLGLFGGYVVRAARPPSPRALRCLRRTRTIVDTMPLFMAAA